MPSSLSTLAAGVMLAGWLAGASQVRAEGFASEAVLGPADAPVTVVEYASMTCPHCAAFHAKAMPALKQEYIDKGRIRLIYRDVPLDGMALKAAMVARWAARIASSPSST
jgi:protein-disulfide isomerase